MSAETLDMLEFYDTLSPEDLQGGFQQDKAFASSTVSEILQVAKDIGDAQFLAELEAKLKNIKTLQ